MKTIVCGPPHSGKSVFVANLVRLLPSDSYLRINANGDGEGTWSNNSDQNEIQKFRYKTSNSQTAFSVWASNIRKASQDIVIIDIGGRLASDKGPLFDAADSFIVLSSSRELMDEWKRFGESHDCKCLGLIESCLDGEHSIMSKVPCLHARIANLNRGSNHTESIVLKTVAETLVRESGYLPTKYVDFHQIGINLGLDSTWNTMEGIPVSHVHFETSSAPALYAYLKRLYVPHARYRFFNLKVNWVAALATMCLEGNGDSSTSFYDFNEDAFVDSVNLRVDDCNTDAYSCTVRETENAVFLSIVANEMYLNRADAHLYSIPRLNVNKILLLSGRLPAWFIASVFKSYDSSEKYLLQPGNHYICIASKDVSILGSIYSEIE